MPTGIYKRTKDMKTGKHMLGRPSYRKGKIASIETRKKISDANYKRFSIGEEFHPRWKGDEVSYRSLHKWVEKHLGKPHFCEHCKKSDLKHRQYHWANISGEYIRNVNDWRRLCVKCHKAYDSTRK